MCDFIEKRTFSIRKNVFNKPIHVLESRTNILYNEKDN